jgi:Uma2 family endonuclease
MKSATAKRRSGMDYENFIFDTLPRQGEWTEEEYLSLTDSTNRMVEFTDGVLEPLPMPTNTHQLLLKFLFLALHAYLEPRQGIVQFAVLRLRLRPGKFREPDLLALLDVGDERCQDRFWTGADLLAEVVSNDKPSRDLVQKKREYAQAGIPEYWIVDPFRELVIVYRLQGKRYARHGLFRRGQQATSALLAGFSVDVTALFNAARMTQRKPKS